MGELQKTPDRRVMKTKKAIHNAFAKLLSEKELDHITVKDIADAADINRKTFYNYYDGVYQVVDEIENEIVRTFDETLQGVDFRNAMQNPYVFFEKLTAIINSDMDFYDHLIQTSRSANLVEKLVSLLCPRTMEALRPYVSIGETELRVAVNFAIYGMIAAYSEWFNSDRSVPIETVAESVGHMTVHGLQGYFKHS